MLWVWLGLGLGLRSGLGLGSQLGLEVGLGYALVSGPHQHPHFTRGRVKTMILYKVPVTGTIYTA